ncbi:MAG TPA: DUF6379 domain-containing protein [Dehalococcoidia bacterium]|nr:DUF6379 domain-containing protein [Dehalococcoidia bacterium]
MLATKQELQKWIDAGKQRMREDAESVEIILRHYSEILLRDDIMQNCSIDLGHKKIGGFSFNMYQPWYKASPLGMIHDIHIVIDGEVIPRESIQLIIRNGQRFDLCNASTIQDIWWNVVEPITVFAHKEGGLAPGNHELEVTIAEQTAEYYENPLNMIMGSVKKIMQVS